MQLCTKERIIELIQQGQIIIANIDTPENLFLDDIRIGLRLRRELLEVCGPIDLKQTNSTLCKKTILKNVCLEPGKFYLGLSMEELCLPNNIMGFINTRSKYARIGFEVVRSSVFVIPGFGNGTPTPLVFEISTTLEVKNLDADEKYAFLLLYELPKGINLIGRGYSNRFPFAFFDE